MFYDQLLRRLQEKPENSLLEELVMQDAKALGEAKPVIFPTKQAEVFIHRSFQIMAYPHLIFPSIFINFTEPFEVDRTRYRGLLMQRGRIANRGDPSLVSFFESGAASKEQYSEPLSSYEFLWYSDLAEGVVPVDPVALVISPQSFPNPESGMPRLSDEAAITGVSAEHEERVGRIGINIMYFLSCDNVTVEYHEPRDKETKTLMKGMGQRTLNPFYTVAFKRGGSRTRSTETGTGRKHKIRYDVRGTIRHLYDEVFKRNPDGTIRTVWVPEHQRGLANELYVPALRDASKVPVSYP